MLSYTCSLTHSLDQCRCGDEVIHRRTVEGRREHRQEIVVLGRLQQLGMSRCADGFRFAGFAGKKTHKL